MLVSENINHIQPLVRSVCETYLALLSDHAKTLARESVTTQCILYSLPYKAFKRYYPYYTVL